MYIIYSCVCVCVRDMTTQTPKPYADVADVC